MTEEFEQIAPWQVNIDGTWTSIEDGMAYSLLDEEMEVPGQMAEVIGMPRLPIIGVSRAYRYIDECPSCHVEIDEESTMIECVIYRLCACKSCDSFVWMKNRWPTDEQRRWMA